MKIIDFDSWERKDHFNCFSKNLTPMYGITTKLDITKVYDFTKKNKLSFYFTLGHIVQTAINEIEEFNIRIEKGKLVIRNHEITSFTAINQNESAFKFIDIKYTSNIKEFCDEGKRMVKEQKGLFSENTNTDYGSFFSCLPWFEATAIANPKSSDPDEFIPRIVWDKIHEENGIKTVNFSIEVNHRIIDGYHIGLLVEKIKDIIRNLE